MPGAQELQTVEDRTAKAVEQYNAGFIHAGAGLDEMADALLELKELHSDNIGFGKCLDMLNERPSESAITRLLERARLNREIRAKGGAITGDALSYILQWTKEDKAAVAALAAHDAPPITKDVAQGVVAERKLTFLRGAEVVPTSPLIIHVPRSVPVPAKPLTMEEEKYALAAATKNVTLWKPSPTATPPPPKPKEPKTSPYGADQSARMTSETDALEDLIATFDGFPKEWSALALRVGKAVAQTKASTTLAKAKATLTQPKPVAKPAKTKATTAKATPAKPAPEPAKPAPASRIAVRVAKYYANFPKATYAEVANALGIGTGTVKKYKPKPQAGGAA